MKTKILSKKVVITIICLIAGYLVIIPLSLWIMAYSSMMSQAEDVFLNTIYVESEENWEQQIVDGLKDGSWGHLQLFEPNGTLVLDSYDRYTNNTTDYYYSAEKYVGQVSKDRVAQKIGAAYDSGFDILRIVYVYGVPVKCGEKLVGVAFNIHSPLYFSQTLKTFLMIFSAAYLIAAISVVLILIMQRKFENDRQIYIANVTHALKTPVTAIKALAESLCDDDEPDMEEQKIDLQLILQEADTQVEMVNNILSLSRIQTKRQNIKKRIVSAAELVNDPVKKHLQQCKVKNIELKVSENLDEFKSLRSDPDACRQIIDVLLDNAVKFTDENGHIWVNVKNGGNRAIISVKDDGKGIDKAIISRVFDRFYTTSQGNAEGTGLGLAIARELARSLGEKIWVESNPGKGTEVFFTIRKK